MHRVSALICGVYTLARTQIDRKVEKGPIAAQEPQNRVLSTKEIFICPRETEGRK